MTKTRISVVCAAICFGSCIKYPPRVRSAPKPDTDFITVDFSAVFQSASWSDNQFFEPKQPGVMKHVLLGPNLVHSSSRSTLAEPATEGPEQDGLNDAVGRRVEPRLSGKLMQFLNKRGSRIYAPAVTRRWCKGNPQCESATWVERVLMLRKNSEKSPDAVTIGAAGDVLPTVALAIERLEIGWRLLDVVIEKRDNSLVVVPRTSMSQSTECSNIVSIEVPVVELSAEILSLDDGRVLARVHDAIPPRPNEALERRVVALEWDPEKREGHARTGKYKYVASWVPRNVTCENTSHMVSELGAELVEAMEGRTESGFTASLEELFQSTLAPLY